MKLSKKDTALLNRFISLFPNRDESWTLDEIQGFFFGLAMIPEPIMPSEWIQELQQGYELEYSSMKEANEIHQCIIDQFNNHLTKFIQGTLRYPFTIDPFLDDNLSAITDWVSGFLFALSLREEYWTDEMLPPGISQDLAEEAGFAYFMVNAILYPQDARDMFASLPKSRLKELDFDSHDSPENDMKIIALALSGLEEHVNILIEFATELDAYRKHQMTARPHAMATSPQLKIGRNQPCPCGSGKKYKKCCLQSESTKTNNIIPVDFKTGKIISHKPHKTKNTPSVIYQLKIGLKWAKPPIWRRIQVPGNFGLDELHEIIQIVMGWSDYHMHHFEIDKVFYEPPNDEKYFDALDSFTSRDEAEFTIEKVLGDRITRFHYVYDFGDDWVHQIDVEKTLPQEEGETYPKLLTGRKACPPEDCGGIYGYMQYLQDFSDPQSEFHEESLEILDDFDPDQFGKEEKKDIQEILEEHFS